MQADPGLAGRQALLQSTTFEKYKVKKRARLYVTSKKGRMLKGGGGLGQAGRQTRLPPPWHRLGAGNGDNGGGGAAHGLRHSTYAVHVLPLSGSKQTKNFIFWRFIYLYTIGVLTLSSGKWKTAFLILHFIFTLFKSHSLSSPLHICSFKTAKMKEEWLFLERRSIRISSG